MEEIKLSDEIIEQIKDFEWRNLTGEQSTIIEKLILNEELNRRYKDYGLCKECKQPKAGRYYNNYWCQSCNSKHFHEDFKNWTSGNYQVDKFIQSLQIKSKDCSEVLEWIEYDRLEKVEYLAKGGFGITYKAIWKDGYILDWDPKNNQWERSKKSSKTYENYPVVLKCLHNSQDIAEFLREIESHIKIESIFVIRCHGITKDPTSNNFMMVMEYAENGSLRQYLNNNFDSLEWVDKLYILQRIAEGLKYIHEYGLIHRDFHCGNVLRHRNFTFITDLGLCKPANLKPSRDEYKKVYGVLPYVAPEVLRENEYTQESDVYGFGIIAYEVCTGLPPYHDIAHEVSLAINVCRGLRPKSNYKIPKIILNIIKQCWDADPLKRPKANKLHNLLYNFYYSSINHEINNQIEEAVEINEKLTTTSSLYTGIILSYNINSQAIYTSRLLDFKNLPEPKNDNDDEEYSESLMICYA